MFIMNRVGQINQFMTRIDQMKQLLTQYNTAYESIKSTSPVLAETYKNEMEQLGDSVIEYADVREFIHQAKWNIAVGLCPSFQVFVEQEESIDLDQFIKGTDVMIAETQRVIDKYQPTITIDI